MLSILYRSRKSIHQIINIHEKGMCKTSILLKPITVYIQLFICLHLFFLRKMSKIVLLLFIYDSHRTYFMSKCTTVYTIIVYSLQKSILVFE